MIGTLPSIAKLVTNLLFRLNIEKNIGDKNKLLENMKLNKVINTLCTASTVDGTKCLTEAAQFFWLDHP